MHIGAISGYRPVLYNTPSANAIVGVENTAANQQTEKTANTTGLKIEEQGNKKVDKTDPSYECQTCENRKYQDGSDEHDVSFKNATKVAPEAAASAVRSHEQMHVKNAYQKADEDDAKVVSANVTIHTSICPECGKTYVSGGTTRTMIKYGNEDNPYQKNLKNLQGGFLRGMNLDMEA